MVFLIRKKHSRGVVGSIQLVALTIVSFSAFAIEPTSSGPQASSELLVCPPTPGNVRNTEASVVELKDGRLLLAYTRFRGGGGDNDSADIAGKTSSDGGRTWSAPFVLQKNDGRMNVMSASLLRLSTGDIMLGYLRKNSQADCSFWVRKSKDEGKTWMEEVLVTKDTAYHVVNNDRIVELKSGRLLVPAADHADYRDRKPAVGVCYISDDRGETWRRGKGVVRLGGVGCQEPGVVELKDGPVYMIIRTSLGHIHRSLSSDGGETWTQPHPTKLRSPTAPASIRRIPKTGELLIIWNNSPTRRRVPLTSTVSRDEGETWTNFKDIEPANPANENGSFAYTSILFVKDSCYLTYWTALPTGYALKFRALPTSWFSESSSAVSD